MLPPWQGNDNRIRVDIAGAEPALLLSLSVQQRRTNGARKQSEEDGFLGQIITLQFKLMAREGLKPPQGP